MVPLASMHEILSLPGGEVTQESVTASDTIVCFMILLTQLCKQTTAEKHNDV